MENHTLSKRARTALGAEYRWTPRTKHPDEVPPRSIAHQPWEPRHPDLRPAYVRPGADVAQGLPSRGLAT